VRAAACGSVELAGSQGAYGRMVCLRHSTTFVTCYAHLSAIARRRGSVIARGQVIGRVGMTGRTSGPHLHFETRVNGTARDPEPYLAGTRAIPG
jgi:murein DD-endopeptidase MepM/ murein hydrolase activator NlpD